MASTISAGTSTGTALNLVGDTSGALALQTNNGTTALTINTTQNIGIGTATTPYKLNVVGTIYAYGTSATYLSQDTGGAWFANAQGADFAITESGVAERMRIKATTGYVGIGLTTLTEKFEVNGSINASTASSNNFATGNARAFMDYVPGSNTARFGQLNGASGLTTGKVTILNNTLESIVIDASGRVTMPYNPAFMAGGNTGQQTITNGLHTHVTGLNVAKYNFGSNYDTSTSTFTAPVAGLYAFKMYVTIATSSPNAITGGNDFQVKLYVNGADYSISGSNGDYGGNPVGYFASSTRLSYAYLNAGDVARIYMFQNTGSSVVLQLAMCNFSGYLVR